MKENEKRNRLIVGISGASGVVMGYEMLKALRRQPSVEIHLILTESAKRNFALETNLSLEEVAALADRVYAETDLAAPIASGSYKTEGMVIIPCSMKTLSALATGYSSNLLTRAADVCRKENRRVILVPREMPLSNVHLRNMETAAGDGYIMIPPMLTFYNGADTLQKQMDHIIGKILRQFNMESSRFVSWKGTE